MAKGTLDGHIRPLGIYDHFTTDLGRATAADRGNFNILDLVRTALQKHACRDGSGIMRMRGPLSKQFRQC